MKYGWFLLMFGMLTTCRQVGTSDVHPHGLGLVELPFVADPQVFTPAEGRYAELVCHGDHWKAFIDEVKAGEAIDEDQITEICKIFKQRMDVEGLASVLLISADGSTPMSSLQSAVRAGAASGIGRFDLQVRPHSALANDAAVYSVTLDVGCMHCRLSGWHSMIPPLEVMVSGDGSIQEKIGDSQVVLDDARAASGLPGLDARVREHAEKAGEADAAPWVKVLLVKEPRLQRFVDVLKVLEVHRMVADFTTPYTEEGSDDNPMDRPDVFDPSLRPLPIPRE